MRRGTADIGDERREMMLLEGDDVRRRQVMRDDDQVLFLDPLRGAQRRPADMAGELLDDALDHLPDVLPALAQIGVLEFVELRDQLLHLLHQRPFRIAAALTDERLRHLAQLGIVEDHAMQVEKGAELGGCMLGAFLHRRQLALHLLERSLEAGHLLVHHARRNGQVGNFQRCMRDQVGRPDGDAAGNAQAVEGKAHVKPPAGPPQGEAEPPRGGEVGNSRRTAPRQPNGLAGTACPPRAMSVGAVPFTPPRRTCRRSAPAAPSSPPARRPRRFRRPPANPCRPPASSRP